jgi:hypothetical protein
MERRQYTREFQARRRLFPRSQRMSAAVPDRIGWQHKAGMTEMLADLSRMVRTLDAYR